MVLLETGSVLLGSNYGLLLSFPAQFMRPSQEKILITIKDWLSKAFKCWYPVVAHRFFPKGQPSHERQDGPKFHHIFTTAKTRVSLDRLANDRVPQTGKHSTQYVAQGPGITMGRALLTATQELNVANSTHLGR